MSYADFQKILQRLDPEDLEQRALAYEEFIRYIATGHVNSQHATKIARLYMQAFEIPRQSPK